jgi:DNA-binding NarL/FixJ family response regulator
MPAFLIADDHVAIREGLKRILTEEFGEAIFGEARNGEEALSQIRSRDWDLVLLDISMPDRSGLEVLDELRHEGAPPPVLVLSVHLEGEFGVRVLKKGAAGYVSKDCPREELVGAVRTVLSGGKHVSPSLAEGLLSLWASVPEAPCHELLSNREFQVMCALASGKRLTALAKELSLSVKTVATYRHRLLQKMRMNSNAELARYAVEHKLLL